MSTPKRPGTRPIRTSDLLGLPTAQVKIMRIMLRLKECDYAAMSSVVDSLPEGERFSRPDMDAALAELVGRKFLVRTMERPADAGEFADEVTMFRLGSIDRAWALTHDRDYNRELEAGIDSTREMNRTPVRETTPSGGVPSSASSGGTSTSNDKGEKTPTGRRQSGIDRINSFWGKVGAETDSGETIKRGNLFDELMGGAKSTPSPSGEAPKDKIIVPKKERAGTLFDELRAKPAEEKADKPPETPSENTSSTDPTLPHRPRGLLDDIRATTKKAANTTQEIFTDLSKKASSGRLGSLFDELAAKPREAKSKLENTDSETKPDDSDTKEPDNN